MEMLFGNDNTVKYVIFSVLLLFVVVFLGIFKLITDSILLGIVALMALLYYLLRMVGAFIMYPGSSFVSRSDIEIRMSREISARMIVFFNSTHFLHLCVAQKKYVSHQNQYDFVVVIVNHILMMKDMLAMFESSLSTRKLKMLNNYRQIEELIEQKEEQEFSIYDLIQHPRTIDSLTENNCTKLRQKFESIERRLRQLHGIIESYSPPDGTCNLIKFKIFDQNLFEIRFGFQTWKNTFDYEINLVNTSNEGKIETVVIHHELDRRFMVREDQSKKVDLSKATVLFCNPNGVFIQFFGYDNHTIRNYLKQDYNVILWNYRGYGQSTGTPSILKSQMDAYNVYEFYRAKGYNIKIVHGYSIGGAAAVGLFQYLPEQHLKDIEVLIIDRSFSSIGQMSIQFGPALHKITKLIFLGDNIDLSKQFESIRCNKLLIWDNQDEVIPDRASVKNRIIKRKSKASSTSIYQFHEDAEVHHLNEDNQQPDFESLTQKLAYTLRKILQHISNSNSTEQQICILKDVQRDTSDQTVLSNDTNQVDKAEMLVKIVSRLDGGGIKLLNEPIDFKNTLNRRPDLFYHICQSYVLGMVCYGSYFPLEPILHDHQKIKQNTLLKLEKHMTSLAHKFEIDTAQPEALFKKDDSIQQLACNMYHIYFKLAQMVGEYFSQEWFWLHGSLLPTNNGHNCNFTSGEYQILNKFIRHSLQVSQLQEGEEKQKII